MADARSVEELVQDVLQGRVRVPGWQRGIKWRIGDARKLLDSLYRGYPIGTLLFWKKKAPAESIRFGTVRVEAKQRTDALYVVDGQQRVTSLVRVLAGLGAPNESFALYFDPASREIVKPSRGRAKSSWLPLTEVLDSRKLMKWLIAHEPLPDDARDAAIDLGARIREYPVPSYIVESDDEQAVREVFERTNNTGQPLTANEVFDGRFRDLDAIEPRGLRDVGEDLATMGFGELDLDQLHNMMLSVRFTDLTKADTSSWNAEEAQAALADTRSAARRVLSFLRDDALIPNLSLLPYSQPLLTLTRFFHFHPCAHPRNRVLLARWVWRGAAAGLHSGASVGTRATLAAIDDDEHATVQRLLALVKPGMDTPFAPAVDRFRSSDASARICALALAELGPRDLTTGEPLDLGEVSPIQITKSGPKKSSLGNRMLHTPVRGDVSRAISACESDEVLASHDIMPADRKLVSRDLDAFVEARCARLLSLARLLVRRRTMWDDSDRPPLESLVIEDRP